MHFSQKPRLSYCLAYFPGTIEKIQSSRKMTNRMQMTLNMPCIHLLRNLRRGQGSKTGHKCRINKKSMRISLMGEEGERMQWYMDGRNASFKGPTCYCSNDMIACVNASLSRLRLPPPPAPVASPKTVTAFRGRDRARLEKSSGTPCSYSVVHIGKAVETRKKAALASLLLSVILRGQQRKSQSSSVFGSAENLRPKCCGSSSASVVLATIMQSIE